MSTRTRLGDDPDARGGAINGTFEAFLGILLSFRVSIGTNVEYMIVVIREDKCRPRRPLFEALLSSTAATSCHLTSKDGQIYS
jgi:hypothetical protein